MTTQNGKPLITDLINQGNFHEFPIENEREVLAKAFDILMGENHKPYWNINARYGEMRSIIIGNTQPCVEFKKWVECVMFLSSFINMDIQK
jgi:hypothetical protein